MDGYNRGYQHYQPPPSSYGGVPGNAGSGGRGPPPNGNPPPAPQQAFYGHQNSGFTYNFNYVPPPTAAPPTSYPAPRLPSMSMQQPTYASPSPVNNNSGGGGYINPSMLHTSQPQQQQQQQSHSPAPRQQPSQQQQYHNNNNRPHSTHPPPPPPPSSASRSLSTYHDTTMNRSNSHSRPSSHSTSSSSSRHQSSTYQQPHSTPSSHQNNHHRQHHSTNSPSTSSGTAYGTSSRTSSSKVSAPTNVDEALQYTPLNSILPFHDHIIPSPTIDASNLAARSEAIGNKLLKDFNHLDPMSKRFRTATNEISTYINTVLDDKRIKIDFKKSKPPSSSKSGKPLDDLLRNSKLGIFENAVLNKLSLQNQNQSHQDALAREELHQTSKSSTPAAQPLRTPIKNSSTTPTKSTPSNNFYIAIPPVSSSKSSQQLGNDYTVNSNSPVLINRNISKSEEFKPISGDHNPSGQVVEAVLLPPPRKDFNPAEYASHAATDAQIRIAKGLKSRKRRKIGTHDDNDALIASVDTRAKAELAVNTLQTILISIFEAEDNLQPDTSGNVASYISNIFIPVGALAYSTETTGQCLSHAVQVQLGQALRSVNLYNRLDKMDLDDVLRLLKTCENTLKAAESLDVKIGEDARQSENGPVVDWDKRIAFAENSLETCKTILRVMTGGRQEKQVYSEELLNSIHQVLKNLLEGSIIPLIGLRSDQESAFKLAMQKKKDLRSILKNIVNIFKLLTQLLANQELTEDFLIKMIYTSVALVFIDNATNDKDTVFGVQRVEALRVTSMNVLAKIFARYPEQDESITNEILTNLDKLPVGRASAKNYKLADGKNIQLISALMMSLVQSAGTYQERIVRSAEITVGTPPDEEMANGEPEHPLVTAPSNAHTIDMVMQKLGDVSERYHTNAIRQVTQTTSHIIQRALNTAKSAEGNSRNLLDLMLEDFILVLDNPDWPAAEMFLRVICNFLIQVVDNPKSTVPAKSAALELLGKLGSCINELSAHLKDIHRAGNVSGPIDTILTKCTEDYLDIRQNAEGKTREAIKQEKDAALRKMVLWKGPFKMILEHLWEVDQRPDEDNLHTAWGFFASVWATRLCQGFRDCFELDVVEAADIAQVSDSLHKMINEREWYDEEDEVDGFRRQSPTSMQLRQAYLLIILEGDFCNYSPIIYDRLLNSIDADQTSARSKGLKALMHLIEKDTSILEERTLLPILLERCKDSSPQVRDSALDIIGRCLMLKPELEGRVLPSICGRAKDTNVPLRKRAIKLLRDIYSTTKNPDHKPEVAMYLLSRVNDPDAGVAEQARRSFEDLWVNQSYPQLKDGDDGELSLKGKLIIKERVGVITKVVTSNDKLDQFLSSLIEFFLEAENKQVEQNTKVCKLMVQALFTELLELSEDDKSKKQSIMRTLVVFARASASLFQVAQLDLLKPYIKDLSSADDMAVYRSAIIIFRCVLPNLSSAHSNFLKDVAAALLTNVSKLPTTELEEAIYCLSAINQSHDISQRLVAMFCSCVVNLKPNFEADTKALNPRDQRKIARLSCIIGLSGKYCGLERYSREIRAKLQAAKVPIKNSSISEFIVDIMLKFAGEQAEASVRKSALEAIGDVAKSHPEQYMRSVVTQTFEDVFKSGDREFILLVIKSFMEFLSQEEKSSEEALKRGKGPAASKESIAIADYDPGRLTGASTATSRDGVSTALAQTFLDYILRIALSSTDDYGYAAVELVGSVLRQGLVHPKECTPALVALGTCHEMRIQNIASRELKGLAQKHESIVERAYMEGFRLAFKYQRDVIGSRDGAETESFNPKLGNLYSLTLNNRKVKKKFLGNLVAAIEFEPNKLSATDLSHLIYSRFVLQNLAYFEYASVEDIHQVASGLEKIVGNIGTTIAHQIETDVLQIIRLENEEPKPVDDVLKKKLAVASVILTMAWNTRTYLRKLYGVTQETMHKRAKNTKDLAKAPTKLAGMGGSGLWDEMTELMETLETDAGMAQQFTEFLELHNIDEEYKRLAENEDEDLFNGIGGPDDDSDAGGIDGTPHRGRGRPRKRKTGTTPPPNKAKRRKKKADGTPGDDDHDEPDEE